MTTKQNAPDSDDLAQRKQDHIDLTARSQTFSTDVDQRFDYEPLFFTHPDAEEKWETTFLAKKLDYPVWISSMTGGTSSSRNINHNLARLCGKYKLGMGLGSCRSLLTGHDRLEDFAVRKFLGDQPLYANLGIAQLEEMVREGRTGQVNEMIKSIEADGLIIHLNPLQEWFQPGGDRFKISPHLTISRFLEATSYPVMVKEVGQGMGPKSLKTLLEMPLAGIEFAAFGGTNFSLLESLRAEEDEIRRPFINVGHTAQEMVSILNALPTRNKEFIISGGIRNVLDGYELKSKLKANSVIGMAQRFLSPAQESYESLENYFFKLREALLTAKAVLQVKENL